MHANSSPALPSPSAIPRFRWPMRIFLTLIIFDMVFHSLANVFDYSEWRSELAMTSSPKPLPSWPEICEITDTGKGTPVSERWMETLDSAWDFARPWPGKESRTKIDSWEKTGAWVSYWLGTRIGFPEKLLGLRQDWSMFSPSVATKKQLARARLVFADGSTQTVRLSCDPVDLTCYSYFGNYRVMNYEDDVHSDGESRRGYFNLLKFRYPTNQHGAQLDTIFLYTFTYRFPGPDDDAAAFLRAQSGPPGWEKTPSYEYVVKTGKVYSY